MRRPEDPNAPACPTLARDGNWQPHHDGMTIRATMAMHIIAGLMANSAGRWSTQKYANDAVEAADALIAELNRTTQP